MDRAAVDVSAAARTSGSTLFPGRSSRAAGNATPSGATAYPSATGVSGRASYGVHAVPGPPISSGGTGSATSGSSSGSATFTESGLASGTVGGVTIGGLTKYTSASLITFVGLTSGATYTVDLPRGYTATPPSGTLSFGGTVTVSFSTGSATEPAAAGISSAGSGGSSGLLVLVRWTAMVGALVGGLLLALRRSASSRRER